MKMRVGLAQCGFPDDGDVLAQVARMVQQASEEDVDLLVFPEDLMSPRQLEDEELRAVAEPLEGPFVREMARLAQESQLWIVFTCYETDPAGGAPFNTAVVLDDQGKMRGSYRKCHLYDAHGVWESHRTQAGDALAAPIETPFGRLGVGICYDLRFPELARAAALGGCQLLVFPSAWHDGPQKAEHWQTLLRARAIENELWVAGVCKAGERYVGQSMVCDPLGRVVARAEGKDEQLLTCVVDSDCVTSARDAMPLLSHRRPELY